MQHGAISNNTKKIKHEKSATVHHENRLNIERVEYEKRCNMKRVQYVKLQLGKSATRNECNTKKVQQ